VVPPGTAAIVGIVDVEITEVEFTTASGELREVVLLVVLGVVDGARQVGVRASSIR